jgi:hypothetical protein
LSFINICGTNGLLEDHLFPRGPCEYIIVQILEILELSLSLFQVVYIRSSCLELKNKNLNEKKFAYTMDIFVKTTGFA